MGFVEKPLALPGSTNKICVYFRKLFSAEEQVRSLYRSTRRTSPLGGLSSSSCGGFLPSALPGQKKTFYGGVGLLRHFYMLSSNLKQKIVLKFKEISL